VKGPTTPAALLFFANDSVGKRVCAHVVVEVRNHSSSTSKDINMQIKILITSLALAISGAAFAQASAPKAPLATPKLDKMQANQQKRIEQGESTGQLTPHEANKLEKKEAVLQKHEDAAKADGKVTSAERKKMLREANRDSKKIHSQKHDAQKIPADPRP
jgi:high-affinity K+ transport system ATPase subunit B